jgi:hypothetical protein
MSRFEYKYYIPNIYLDELRRDFMPYLKYDQYMNLSGKKEYTVRSIYMDSPNLLTYYQKVDGHKERNKFRIRGYDKKVENSLVFVEIKRKDVDQVSKDRIKLLYRDLEKFMQTNDYSLLPNYSSSVMHQREGIRNFLYYYNLYQLEPTVLIIYDREAFECPFGSGLRVTFDKNIRAKATKTFQELYTNENLTNSLKDYFVLEIKFHKSIPNWLPAAMRKYDAFRDSASKYMMSIESTSLNTFFKYLV